MLTITSRCRSGFHGSFRAESTRCSDVVPTSARPVGLGKVNVTAAFALGAIVSKAAPNTPAINSVLNRDKAIPPQMITATLPARLVIGNPT
jgi:hypothetical protein